MTTKLRLPQGTFAYGGTNSRGINKQMTAYIADTFAQFEDATAIMNALGAASSSDLNSEIEGLKNKGTAVLAVTTNVDMSSGYANGDTVQGVTLETGMVISFHNQGADTGLYEVQATGAPQRTANASTGEELELSCWTVISGPNAGDYKIPSTDINLGTTVIQVTSRGATTFEALQASANKTALTTLMNGLSGITAKTSDASLPGGSNTIATVDAIKTYIAANSADTFEDLSSSAKKTSLESLITLLTGINSVYSNNDLAGGADTIAKTPNVKAYVDNAVSSIAETGFNVTFNSNTTMTNAQNGHKFYYINSTGSNELRLFDKVENKSKTFKITGSGPVTVKSQNGSTNFGVFEEGDIFTLHGRAGQTDWELFQFGSVV